MMNKFLAVVLSVVMAFISVCVPVVAAPAEVVQEFGDGIKVYSNADIVSAEKEVDGNIVYLEYSRASESYNLYLNGEHVNCEISDDGQIIYNDIDAEESEIIGQSLAIFGACLGVKELVTIIVAVAAAATIASNPITSLPYIDADWSSGIYYDGETVKEDPDAITIDSAGHKISSKVWLDVDDAIEPQTMEPVYYVANIADGTVKLGATLTEAEAIAWLRLGYNIYTEKDLDAMEIATKASPKGTIVAHDKHGADSCTTTYYKHYHPSGLQSAYNSKHWPHVWYKS